MWQKKFQKGWKAKSFSHAEMRAQKKSRNTNPSLENGGWHHSSGNLLLYNEVAEKHLMSMIIDWSKDNKKVSCLI